MTIGGSPCIMFILERITLILQSAGDKIGRDLLM